MTRSTFLRNLALLAFAVPLAACNTGGVDDGRFATGSQSLVTSSDFSTLYITNPSLGSLTAVKDGEARELLFDEGSEPTRVARVGDRMLVSLRGQRQVAVVTDTGSELQIERTLDTGSEPYGIVASESGKRFWVAESTANQVTEFDGETFEPLRTISVPDQPRFLALHPSGSTLYAGSAYNEGLYSVDVSSGDVERIELPVVETVDGANTTGEAFPYQRRITGDLAISPNGSTLAVPSMYVDNTSEIPAPISGYYDSSPGGTGSRFNPTLVTFQLDENGGMEPNSGMVVVTDITANVRDIHPGNKLDVGRRLARWALAKNYGKTKVVFSGPLYQSMETQGRSIRLSFKHIGGELKSLDGKALREFTIAGEDRKFVAAQARIRGQGIIVSAEGVDRPVAVRFGWREAATPNFGNAAGLPAVPFRTDDW